MWDNSQAHWPRPILVHKIHAKLGLALVYKLLVSLRCNSSLHLHSGDAKQILVDLGFQT